MKKTKKSIYLLMTIIVVLIFSGVFVLLTGSEKKAPDVDGLGVERPLYIGDIITLKISRDAITENEIRDPFSEFDIVNIEEKKDFYVLEVRSFEIGKKTVMIKGQRINIQINSLLEGDSRNEIYDGEYVLIEPGINVYWDYIWYGLIFLLTVLVVTYLLKVSKRKEEAKLSAVDQTTKWIDSLSETDDKYFVKLSYYLKWYMENTFNIKVIGKTSRELVEELKKCETTFNDYYLITEWFNKCDFIKFSGKTGLDEAKDEMKTNLRNIISSIEAASKADKDNENQEDNEVMGC